ncbi:hypothetical protein MTR67_039141 [Solanum verrucosum]|uniref:DUF3444 domain-containing protein n=1 Tax=Solanum verrucosum TaxID=315347 RepID=A0AAF0UHI1_SOLVR|nr:hypothetical protein MTR67_039141 [Solanum verrucosum]
MVGQVLVAYDTLDSMPRFYAITRNIFSPAFKLHITWLELEPLNEDETKRLFEGFPASCARCRLGNSNDIEDHPMLSHLFNYEFVEVFSDHVDVVGGHVAYFDKAKAFTCLFYRVGDPFLVPAKDML